MDILIPYLLFGILLSEAVTWARKRRGTGPQMKVAPYLVMTLLWPIALLLTLRESLK
ncbi:hypothetical protein [Roseobacter phage RDJL6]|nr:hypothetical protein [Roseobacter phage RDJL6]